MSPDIHTLLPLAYPSSLEHSHLSRYPNGCLSYVDAFQIYLQATASKKARSSRKGTSKSTAPIASTLQVVTISRPPRQVVVKTLSPALSRTVSPSVIEETPPLSSHARLSEAVVTSLLYFARRATQNSPHRRSRSPHHWSRSHDGQSHHRRIPIILGVTIIRFRVE